MKPKQPETQEYTLDRTSGPHRSSHGHLFKPLGQSKLGDISIGIFLNGVGEQENPEETHVDMRRTVNGLGSGSNTA